MNAIVVVVVLVVQVLRNGHPMQLPLVVQIARVAGDVLVVESSLVERPSQLAVRGKARECWRRSIVVWERVESVGQVIGAASSSSAVDVAVRLLVLRREHHGRCLDKAEECVMFDAATVQVLAGSFLWCLEAIGVYLVLGWR